MDNFTSIMGSARGPSRDETLFSAGEGKISIGSFLELVDLIAEGRYTRALTVVRASTNVSERKRDGLISSGLESHLALALADNEPYTSCIVKVMDTDDKIGSAHFIHEQFVDYVRTSMRDKSTPVEDINEQWVAQQAEAYFPKVVASYISEYAYIANRWMSKSARANFAKVNADELAQAMLPKGFATNWGTNAENCKAMKMRARTYCHQAHRETSSSCVSPITSHSESTQNG